MKEPNREPGFLFSPAEETPYGIAFDASRRRLWAKDPALCAAEAGGRWDEAAGTIALSALGMDFLVDYPRGVVRFGGEEERYPFLSLRLILLNYCSAAKELPAAGRWIRYDEQPGGSVFYPNLRRTVMEPMGRLVDQAGVEALARAGARFGFQPVAGSRADLELLGAYTPRVPLRLLFWRGDEEFPGSFQLLFDLSVSQQMHLEDSAALCGIVGDLLAKTVQWEGQNR